MPRSARLIPLAAAVAACTTAPDATGPTADAARAGEVAAVRTTVRPQDTDPGINLGLDDYIIRTPDGGANGRLFVYLPSSRVGPATGEVVQGVAAALGYHVIGLSYPNNPGLVSFCPATPNPDLCYETTRLEVISGEDLSPSVAVNRANSIENRLIRVLEHLAAANPAAGWERFLAGGTPKWNHIAFGGHSQGAGYAAMMAKLHRIDRAVMLSGVTDAIAGAAATWVTPGETPAGDLYGLVHQQDNQFRAGVLANWAALGMDAFGAAVVPESSTSPYGGARMFVTNITPSTNSFAPPAPHGSTGVDLFTPLGPDGEPVLKAVWQYMLGYCPPFGLDGSAERALVPCQSANP